MTRYRKSGPSAVTDANLLLGRLIPEYFPKIFGKHENELLDVDVSHNEFENLAQNINANSANGFMRSFMGACRAAPGTLFLNAPRFIKVANETMCCPIRALMEAKGFATSSHVDAQYRLHRSAKIDVKPASK
jgi:5-oxoprolinase (ATP-hydrolysing)